jgi:hypothetical protein
VIRLLGILSGSALAVAVLITMLGVPDLATQESDMALPPTPGQVVATPGENEPAPPAAEASLEVPPARQPEQAVEPVVEEPPVEAVPPEQTRPSPAVAETTDIGEEHWYAFWSPFNSQLAANGFIAQLQRTTGLDYRVVKLKPGVYEVAFAYTDETDIETKLAQISSATGLEIPGG